MRREQGEAVGQKQEELAKVQQELVTSNDHNAMMTERAAAAERTVGEMRREQGEATRAAGQKQEELAQVEQELVTSNDHRRTQGWTGQREARTFNADVCEASATPSNVQQHRLTGYEEMAIHIKPVVEGVKAWRDKSVMITVDDCGNCFQSS
ncbi:unnamed protein product [Ectocarpus sp. 12 AP-2014]